MAITNRSVVQRTYGVNALTSSYAHLLFGIDHAKEKEAQLRPLAYGPQFRYAEYLSVGSSKLFAVLFSTLAKFWFMLVFNYAPVSISAVVRWSRRADPSARHDGS